MMRPLVLTPGLVLLWLAGLPAIATDFPSMARAALELHDDANDFAGELEALAAYDRLVEEYPDEWLGLFWSAYLRTQVARLILMDVGKGDAGALLERAQREHDRAAKLAPTTPRERASLDVLQSLIYRFDGWHLQTSGGPAEDHAEKGRAAMRRAIVLDPANPLVLVMAGTGLIGRGEQDDNLSDVVAGKVLLESAQEELSRISTHRSTTTFFNAEWIPFWLPRAEELLSGEADQE